MSFPQKILYRIGHFEGQSKSFEQDEFARNEVITILAKHLEDHCDEEMLLNEIDQRLNEIIEADADD